MTMTTDNARSDTDSELTQQIERTPGLEAVEAVIREAEEPRYIANLLERANAREAGDVLYLTAYTPGDDHGARYRIGYVIGDDAPSYWGLRAKLRTNSIEAVEAWLRGYLHGESL